MGKPVSNSQAVSNALTVEIPRLRDENKRLKEENARLIAEIESRNKKISELDGEAQRLREQLWDMGVEGELA